MFGTIEIPFEFPEGITARRWRQRTSHAREMKKCAASNRQSARVATSLGYRALTNFHSELADGWDDAVADLTSPLRMAFEWRTAEENQTARTLANNRVARFAEPACTNETCDDCEQPLWQHILVGIGALLCPFGRMYWVFARVLLADLNGEGPEAGRHLLREIARRA